MFKKIILWLLISFISIIETTFGFVDSYTDPSVNVPTTSNWDWLVTVVQNFINIVLWLLFLIALAILIWWWFQMVTASWDDNKYQNWFKILKQSSIWLWMIGMSFIILKFIFNIISVSTSWA